MNLYTSLFYMFTISVIIGYFSMPIIISNKSYITWNLNKFYAALLMGWLMALAELFMHSEHLDSCSLIILIIILGSCSIYTIFLIKTQDYIGEKQFYKSMIEHHGMAISMSEQLMGKPEISDQAIKLAHSIIKSQKQEIELMKNLLTNESNNKKIKK